MCLSFTLDWLGGSSIPRDQNLAHVLNMRILSLFCVFVKIFVIQYLDVIWLLFVHWDHVMRHLPQELSRYIKRRLSSHVNLPLQIQHKSKRMWQSTEKKSCDDLICVLERSNRNMPSFIRCCVSCDQLLFWLFLQISAILTYPVNLFRSLKSLYEDN